MCFCFEDFKADNPDEGLVNIPYDLMQVSYF